MHTQTAIDAHGQMVEIDNPVILVNKVAGLPAGPR